MSFLFFFWFAFAGAPPQKAEINGVHPLLHLVSSEFPPFTFQDENGKAAGFMSEVLLEALKEMGLSKQHIDYMPWKRAYTLAVEQKNTLIYPVATVPAEREKIFYWLGPQMKRAIWIYALKEGAEKLHLQKRSDLRGKLVGVTRDYAWGSELKKLGADLDETVDDRILILKLAGKRMPYMAMDEDVANATLKLMKKDDPKFVAPELKKILLLSGEGVRTFGISRKSNPELVNDLRKAFSALEKRGVIKKIESRYPELDFVHRAQ